jgi:hypothetical protein
MSTLLKEPTATHAPSDGALAAGNGASPEGAFDEHHWSYLDPLMQLGVRLAGTLFCGVIVLAFFLVPYALLSNGWTPSP